MVDPIRHRLATLVLLALAGCSTVRLPAIESVDFAPTEDEQQAWRQAQAYDSEVGSSRYLYHDEKLDQYLNQVAGRLITRLASGAPEIRVRVIESPFLNAFALPNGSVYLHTGILSRMTNEAQLATVLAHELAHYVERHAIEQELTARRRRRAAEIAAGILAATAAGLAASPDAAASLMSLMNSATQSVATLQVLGYSRDLEREADRLGFDAMVAAGYDPRQAPVVFDYLREDLDASAVEEPFFFGSHPRLEERSEGYRERLAELAELSTNRPEGVIGAEQYLDAIGNSVRDNAMLDVAIGRIRRATDALERQVAHAPNEPRNYFALGEVYRHSSGGGGQDTQAIESYRRAVALDPAFALAHRELGLLYRANGSDSEAQAHLRRYLELEPGAYDAAIIRGYLVELRSMPAARTRGLCGGARS